MSCKVEKDAYDCLREVSTVILLSSLTHKEERGGLGDVEGSDYEGFDGIKQSEKFPLHKRVLLKKLLEMPSGVLGSVQLTHGAIETVIPSRLEDESAILFVKLATPLCCKCWLP